MIKLSDNNKFIELIENLYDAKFYKKDFESKEVSIYSEDERIAIENKLLDLNKEKEKLESKLFFNNKKILEIDEAIKVEELKLDTTYTIQINKNAESVKKEIEKFIDNLSNKDSIEFDTLWDYAQLLRWAEKVIFYKNDIINYIYSDSEMNSLDKRKFLIQNDEYMMIFSLEKQEISIFDTYTDKEFVEVIKIEIRRKFGKELSNTFVIINRDVKFEDDSDLYLINTINLLLKKSIINSFQEIVDIIDSEKFLKLKDLKNE